MRSAMNGNGRVRTDELDNAQTGSNKPAIVLDGLTKRFGAFTAVDNLSFTVPGGSIFGFLGPNGSGKTTTLGMLLGLVPRDGGTAELLGHNIDHDLSAGLARTGAMVERPGFYPYLSGRQNLTLFARLAGVSDAAVIERTLEAVDLTQRADARFGGYSTGMKQRLGMAAALIKQPDLLVLDEPTSGLDPAGQREIRALIQEIASQRRTVILSSHLLHEVQEICTHVAIIDRGQLVISGTLADILGAPDIVEFRVDRVDEARDLILDMPCVKRVEIDTDYLLAEMAADQSGTVNRALVMAGFDVREVRPRESQLEERFLALTEESNGMGASDDAS